MQKIPEVYMDTTLARKLQQVGEAFKLHDPFFSYEEISQGNVNHTYKTNYIQNDGTGMAVIKSYLVQSVNTYAFKDPVALMENIDKVTTFMHEQDPEALYLHYHHTVEGKTYYTDGESFWRISNFVPAVTFDTCDDIRVVRSAAKAFGDFQMRLSTFDARELVCTIPDFHNTRKRYMTLISDAEKDPLDRVKDVREELDYLLSVMDKACLLTDLLEKGELPLRVTHNDTKINNVLFDPDTHDALLVIDLDTVMPGLVAHDFGDAVRFAANFTEEDSEHTDKTGLDLNIFWAFADGFLSKTASVLTPKEIDTLALSPFVLACELATRFLDDYIMGDNYFACKKPGHNLIRTRCQVALAKDMEQKIDAMDALIKSCVEKYR